MVRGTANGQVRHRGVPGSRRRQPHRSTSPISPRLFILRHRSLALSIIPGGGIVTIPFGIGMIFYGNIAGESSCCCGICQRLPTSITSCGRSWCARDARLELGADVACARRYHLMFGPWGIIIGPGADDFHRHHHRRSPSRCTVPYRTGTTGTTRPPQVAAASRPGHVKKRPPPSTAE